MNGSDSAHEFEGRLVFSALELACALAFKLDVPLKQTESFLQLAQLRGLSARFPELTQSQLAKKIGVSARTFARMIEATRENLFSAEAEHGLPRRIEFLLWSGPKSEARIAQLLSDAQIDEIRSALEALEAQGRIALRDGRTPMYEETQRTHRLVSDSLNARLDGVRNFLEVVEHVLTRRFRHADESAFARTVGFRVRTREIPKLRKFYEEELWPLLERFEEEAHGQSDAQEVGLVFAFSPMAEEGPMEEEAGKEDKS